MKFDGSRFLSVGRCANICINMFILQDTHTCKKMHETFFNNFLYKFDN